MTIIITNMAARRAILIWSGCARSRASPLQAGSLPGLREESVEAICGYELRRIGISAELRFGGRFGTTDGKADVWRVSASSSLPLLFSEEMDVALEEMGFALDFVCILDLKYPFSGKCFSHASPYVYLEIDL